jgi:catechol 2,3-dioxygenase-like lactoylglutathione lyase family enzyme
MKVHHCALACRSEETADRFYEKLLGFKKLERKTVPARLVSAFFGFFRDLAVLSYTRDGIYFEIFIHEGEPSAAPSPAHICLEVEGLDVFLESCRALDIPVIRAPRGDRWVTFIQDYDANLFEIKERTA